MVWGKVARSAQSANGVRRRRSLRPVISTTLPTAQMGLIRRLLAARSRGPPPSEEVQIIRRLERKDNVGRLAKHYASTIACVSCASPPSLLLSSEHADRISDITGCS